MYKILSTKKGGLLYIPNFYSKEQADYILDYIKVFKNPNEISQKVKGSLLPFPRKLLYYGEKNYSYAGITHKATGKLSSDLMKPLNDLKSKDLIKSTTIDCMNSCLVNYYNDENAYIHWHSDDEPELGPDNDKNIIIISLSLGDSRTFYLKSKDGKLDSKIELGNGDMVIMYGDFQKNFEHSISKGKTKKNLRINLTYRIIQ